VAIAVKLPKYVEIYNDLRDAIISGAYRAGDKLPSESELVSKYDTSRITVARALRDLQQQGLIERRAGSGSYVLQTRKAELSFGLLIPDLGRTEIFEPICQGMTRAEQSHHYVLMRGKGLPGTPSQEKQAEELCQFYIGRKASGVFFAPLELTPAKDEVNRRVVRAFDRVGMPVILLDRDIDAYPSRSRYDVVGIDNRRAGYTVTAHLIKLGCKRIAFVARPHSASTVDARISGYREALFAAGFPYSPEWVQRIEPGDKNGVARLMKTIRPEALVCANDHTAAQLMQNLGALGLQVPSDIRIAAFDDVRYASLLPVPLTTVHQPCPDIGAAAIAAMLDRIAHPEIPARDILLDFRLVVRESCGAGSGKWLWCKRDQESARMDRCHDS
jgi:GntR family transcriptional regulator of arabinose operon